MRYHPLTSDDRTAMLAKIGAPNIDALFGLARLFARRRGLYPEADAPAT